MGILGVCVTCFMHNIFSPTVSYMHVCYLTRNRGETLIFVGEEAEGFTPHRAGPAFHRRRGLTTN